MFAQPDGTFVGLEHYQDSSSSFGNLQFGTADGVNNLLKALSTGYTTDAATFTNGRSLIVESLEQTLKIVTFTEQMIRLWKDIQKLPAYSPVEEYNVQSGYGEEGVGAFMNETDMGNLFNSVSTPSETNQTITRKVALVKFMGTTRVVTHPMTLVRTAHGDPIALETQAGTRFLLKVMETKLFEGDAVSTDAEFDGLYVQLINAFDSGSPSVTSRVAAVRAARNSDHIIDMRGEPLSEDVIETATATAVQSYGMPTDLYLATKAMGDLGKIMYPKERVNLPPPGQGGAVGYAIRSITTQHGAITFKPDVFLDAAQPWRFKTLNSAAAGAAAKIPFEPNGTARDLSSGISGGPSAAIIKDSSLAGSEGNGNTYLGGQWQGFTGSGAAVTTQTGTLHFYCLTASNQYGESKPTFWANGSATTSYGMAKFGACVTNNVHGVELTNIAVGNIAGVAWVAGKTRINIYRATVKTSVANTAYAIDATTKFYLIASIPVGSYASGYVDGDPGCSGSVPATSYTDLNETIPGTSTAFLVEHGNQTLSFKQLAPLMKMPFATVTPALRFALLLYGVPIVYAPFKMIIIRNIAGLTQY